MVIPIENIYYLLCYAWDKLDERDRVSVSATDCKLLPDLFAKVLINSARVLLRRGIDRSYVEQTTEIAGIKGKLELGLTLKTPPFGKGRTICRFDEFSADILINQLLVASLYRLIRTRGLDADLRGQLKSVIYRFDGVTPIELNLRLFEQIRLNRQNRFYAFVLNVCRIIYENTLIDERSGQYSFSDFTRDENKMNRVFQSFLFNFYRREQSEFRVRGETIAWQLDGAACDTAFLPQMWTDVTLENSKRKIIIEAKYYRKTLVENRGSEKIHSSHLYQLSAYLRNQPTHILRGRPLTGILVYPQTDKAVDLEFLGEDFGIHVRTVDLSADWREIARRLMSII